MTAQRQLRQPAPTVITLAEIPGMDHAQRLSLRRPGYVWLSPDAHMILTNGAQPAVYYVLDSEYDEMARSQGQVSEWLQRPVPITYSGQARHIIRHRLEAVGISQRHDRQTLRRICDPWHYQHCLPRYPIPHTILYDLAAAYWQIVERAPSPLVTLTDDGAITWSRLDSVQAARWKEVCTRIRSWPRLRHALVGTCCAGLSKESSLMVFHGGKLLDRSPISRMPPLAGLGALAVRCTYEVCAEQQRQLGARYCNIDCVTVEAETWAPDRAMPRPGYWESLRMPYRIRASGPGDIRALGVWRIGDTETDLYAPVREREWCSPHPANGLYKRPQFHHFLRG